MQWTHEMWSLDQRLIKAHFEFHLENKALGNLQTITTCWWCCLWTSSTQSIHQNRYVSNLCFKLDCPAKHAAPNKTQIQSESFPSKGGWTSTWKYLILLFWSELPNTARKHTTMNIWKCISCDSTDYSSLNLTPSINNSDYFWHSSKLHCWPFLSPV